MLFYIGGCQIEDKYVIFVKPENKSAPSLTHQPDMYDLIHSTNEKPFQILKTK